MEFPSYISGFVDGEGSFTVSFNRRAKLKTGIEVRPSFSVSQHRRNLPLLQKIMQHFQCGAIRFSKSDQTYKYEVRSLADIQKSIVPHFKQYPLLGAKHSDFIAFANICSAMSRNHHANPAHLRAIIDEAYTMNPAGKRKYTKENLLRFLTR